MFLLRGEWVNKVCFSAGAERERESTGTYVPRCLLLSSSSVSAVSWVVSSVHKCTKGMCAGNCSTLTIVGSVVERKSVRVLTLAPSKGLI